MTTEREKIYRLFFSTQKENRSLAFELAKGASCYEAVVEEFYGMLEELPAFAEEIKYYYEYLEEEGLTVPEGPALQQAQMEYFADFFFYENVDLSRRYDYANEDKKLKTFPVVLFHMDFIQRLNLGWNAIETIPEEIQQLKQLKALDLSCNAIEGGLPDVIGQLQTLEELILYGMSGVFAKRKYVHEDADRDDYSNEISPCIRQLKNLRVLDLTDIVVEEIPDWIHELQQLEVLCFFSGFGSNPYLKVPTSFTQLPRLKTFQVNAYSFDIPADIDQMQSLEHLTIEPALSIPDSIQRLKNLECLDFSYLSSNYPIRGGRCLWDLYDKGVPEGKSRIELYGWEWLKNMTWLKQFTFRHIAPYAFTELEKAELEAALPNCELVLKEE